MSREDAQVVVRLPERLKSWLKEEAAKNHRSQNSEIVHRLEKSQQNDEQKAA